MSCTAKQAQLIEDLMDHGARIPCKGDGGDPDMRMYDSVQEADAFIKANPDAMAAARLTRARKRALIETSNRIRADEWGGIPNC